MAAVPPVTQLRSRFPARARLAALLLALLIPIATTLTLALPTPVLMVELFQLFVAIATTQSTAVGRRGAFAVVAVKAEPAIILPRLAAVQVVLVHPAKAAPRPAVQVH